MPPPRDDDRLEWMLHRISSAVFPTSLEQYGKDYVRNLLRTVATIDNAEVATEFTIQKFCNELRTSNLRLFAPIPLYLGGRYSSLTHQVLHEAVDAGMLKKRPSRLNELDVHIFEIAHEFKDRITGVPEWDSIFAEFKNRYDLTDFFDAHDRTQIYQWITDTENYIGFDRNLFEKARHGDLNVDIELVSDEVSYNDPKKIHHTDKVYRPFVATGYHLVSEYKQIPSPQHRNNQDEKYRYSKRKFSVKSINRQAWSSDADLTGELALVVGYPDLKEAPVRVPGTWYLRETPTADETLRINFQGRLDIHEHDLPERSLGVLGYIDHRNGEPTLNAFALLESGELPRDLIDEQRGQISKRLDTTVAEIDETTKQLQEDIEAVLPSLASEEDQSKVRQLVDKLRTAIDDAERITLLQQFIEENPELAWIAEKAINNIKA